jgi:hypothetical protein
MRNRLRIDPINERITTIGQAFGSVASKSVLCTAGDQQSKSRRQLSGVLPWIEAAPNIKQIAGAAEYQQIRDREPSQNR